jgi:broad specificity phosphatase PhoE
MPSSRAMRVYFLRHAESVSNADLGVVALPPERGDRLSDRGREQARLAAAHLGDLGVSRVFSSPLNRARETAQPAGEELGLAVETLDSITELRESEGYGELSAEEQKLHRWSVWMAEHGHDPDYSYRGGESFNDLLGRVRGAKGALEALAEEDGGTLLAVSHGIFLRFFLLDCLLGDGFQASHVPRLWQLRTVNCGLSLFECVTDDEEKDPSPDPWRCLTWMARPWDPP